MLDNKQKNDLFFKIITIVLIIIIIILLFFGRFGKINNYPLPTGNVDVFDININIGYLDKSSGKTENGYVENIGEVIATSDNNYDINKKIYKYNKEKDYKTLNRVFVDDVNGNYVYQKKLNIFNNAAFNYTNKIAPGVSNTYQFVVHNSSNTNLKYYIEMYEENEYQINLKYRLRNNNGYVIGNETTWVTADALKTELKNLSLSSSDNYSLDWKWFDDDNKKDTEAGEKMKDVYKLNIRFYFEAVEA